MWPRLSDGWLPEKDPEILFRPDEEKPLWLLYSSLRGGEIEQNKTKRASRVKQTDEKQRKANPSTHSFLLILIGQKAGISSQYFQLLLDCDVYNNGGNIMEIKVSRLMRFYSNKETSRRLLKV